MNVLYVDAEINLSFIAEFVFYCWWITLCRVGKKYGYTPNAGKTWLIIKDESMLDKAKELFEPLGVNITLTVKGKRHLGAVVGSTQYKDAT